MKRNRFEIWDHALTGAGRRPLCRFSQHPDRRSAQAALQRHMNNAESADAAPPILEIYDLDRDEDREALAGHV